MFAIFGDVHGQLDGMALLAPDTFPI